MRSYGYRAPLTQPRVLHSRLCMAAPNLAGAVVADEAAESEGPSFYASGLQGAQAAQLLSLQTGCRAACATFTPAQPAATAVPARLPAPVWTLPAL